MAPPSGRPEMRAGQVRTDYENLLTLPDGAALRAALSPASVQQIEQTPRSLWVPLELDIELAEVVCARLGEEATRQWSRDAMVKSFEGPLLNPITQATIQIFGLKPSSLLRFAPRMWPAICRGCGELGVGAASGASSLELQLTRAPALLLASRPYVISLAGACDGALGLCKGHGRTEFVIKPETSSVVFSAHWTDAA